MKRMFESYVRMAIAVKLQRSKAAEFPTVALALRHSASKVTAGPDGSAARSRAAALGVEATPIAGRGLSE